MVDAMDRSIAMQEDEELTLRGLASRMGYSPCYLSRKFREITGMGLRDYLRRRRLAFALKEVRDSRPLRWGTASRPIRRLPGRSRGSMASPPASIAGIPGRWFFAQK